MSDAVQQTQAAAERLKDIFPPTALDFAVKSSAALNNKIYLKREDLQPVHSFKIRGAYNKASQLNEADKHKGVIAASAGNHAQGLALSGQELGIKATIVMPRTTPDIKVAAVKGYGGTVVLHGDNFSEAYEHCLELIKTSEKVFIHPFDDADVIAGQGTVAKEILDQLEQVDYIFVPIGGGGLAAGIAQYVKAIKPEIMVIGVEPADSNTMQQSLKNGQPTMLSHVGIFADGVAVKQAGDLTFQLCQAYLDEVMTVTTDQMCAAIKAIYEDTRSIVEPAGALSLAGAKKYLAEHDITGKTVATICSGANMSFEKLQFVAERTLLGSGQEALFSIKLPETPGALQSLCVDIIKAHNITEFCYRLQQREQADILLGLKITDETDRGRFANKLKRLGYDFEDISQDDVAKEHIRHMVGGYSAEAKHEKLYEVYFPERPGALTDFLAGLGSVYNISLFHYRGQGGDTGRVLIGFEADTSAALEQLLTTTGYQFNAITSGAASTFLQKQIDK